MVRACVLEFYHQPSSSQNRPKIACSNMRAFTMNSKGKTLMSVFTYRYNRRNYIFLRKTLIKIFPLEFIVKVRMIEHVILGRLRDESSKTNLCVHFFSTRLY